MTVQTRLFAAPGALLVVFLALPILALLFSSSPAELIRALQHPTLVQATWLSLKTSLVSLTIIVATGLPLSWWLARSRARWAPWIETFVELPVVVPPAVVGVALLAAYGRSGLIGGLFADFGGIPFTSVAVVFAQILVAAPFFVQSATAGFRRVDDDLLLVARTLGATPIEAIRRVAVPAALPSIISGAALAWARALGEFGATLLFAGNLVGETQTMPVAIFVALESDVSLARALAIVLGAAAFGVLLALRVAVGDTMTRRA